MCAPTCVRATASKPRPRPPHPPPARADVYCDRRLPEAARQHEVAVGECLGGALYVNDFIRLCRKVGGPPGAGAKRRREG